VRPGWSGTIGATAVAAAVLLASPWSQRPGLAFGAQAPGAPAQASPAVPQQLPSFRAGVDLVSLNVTVSDPAGRYVTDLAAEQFSVLEDGVRQDVTYFARASLPVALSLLLDTSASMEGRMTTAQEAAIGFARRLGPQDLGQVVDFDRDVRVLQAFTNDRNLLEQAIRRTVTGGSTSLYNAVYIALKELKKVRATSEQEIRRQAIVAFTDGEDTSSLVTYEQVLDLAKRSETAVYAVGLRTKEELAAHGFKEADFVLRQLSQETGGRVFFITQIAELAGVYGQIADELASQYSLGYVSKNAKRDGGWRRIAVRVDRDGAAARTRQGYYGPK
jgi:Ca-activated chloride channel homolog